MNYQLYFSSLQDLDNNSAFLYGQSIFSTVKIMLGRPLFWSDHWDRLEMNVDWMWGDSIDSYKEMVEHKLKEYSSSTRLASVRISFFQKGEQLHWSFHESKLDRIHQTSLKLKTFEHPCFSHDRPNFIKEGSYGEVLRLKKIAEREGYDDILLMHQQMILESSFANIFFVDDQNQVLVPSYEYGFLAGITRKHFMHMLKQNKVDYVEKNIALTELATIKSAWLTSSIKGPRLVERINDFELETESEQIKELINNWRHYLEQYHG